METTLESMTTCHWWQQAFISELSYSTNGLRVVVSRNGHPGTFIEFFFDCPRAFQVMDEGDMLEYWGTPLNGSVLYRVAQGGWVMRTEGHYLQTTNAVMGSGTPYQEWLFVTNELCASVISPISPLVREFSSD